MAPSKRLERVALYLDAIRGMRLRQVAWRPRRLVPPSLLALRTDVNQAPEPNLVAAGLGCSPAPQTGPTEPPHETRRFEGYGASRAFGAPGFWDDPRDGLLFLIHLHGFAPLAAYSRGARTTEGDQFWASVVEDWLARCRTPRSPAWHPYPTSLRVIAWCAALSAIGTWPGALRTSVSTEVLRQARYLRRAIEHDIGGNHVIKNAAALAFAGALFLSSGLMGTALRLLQREVGRQILPDGGHEERSTSYQLEVLSDLAHVRELLRRSSEAVPGWLENSIAAMEGWLGKVSGPDHVLPLLNDAWEAPPLRSANGEASTNLADSGYVVFRHRQDQLLFDAGPLCPRHLPPHAHADALSFVLWADGQPLIVDPGSYAYSGEARDVFRSTAAHNTVEVDGADQCKFWGDFRAAYLPRVARAHIERHDELLVASSRHDGYRRLPQPAMHERTVAWWPDWGVVVLDRLMGHGSHAVGSRLHCAPRADPVSYDRLGPFLVAALGGPGAVVRESSYSPFLGVSVPTRTLEMKMDVPSGRVFGWSLLRPGARVIQVSPSRLVLERPGKRIHAPSFPSGA